MKYLVILLFYCSIIHPMDNKSYQFDSSDKLKRFVITDKKILNGKFANKDDLSIYEILNLNQNSNSETIKCRFFSRYNRLNAKKGPAHRDVKLLKRIGIEHRLLDEDGEVIEYAEPVTLNDEEPDITKDEAIVHLEENQAPPRPHIIQLEQHAIEHPAWLDYMPAFLKLAYGWWTEG